MKICITPNSYENALKLIDQKVDCLLLSLKEFSNRSNYYFSLDEIKKIIEKKQGTKIFVNLNNFIFEQDIKKLTKTLIELSKLNIDKLFFNDYAIAQIDFEEKLNLKLHYSSNTLVTSYHQFPFFVENNIYSVSLPNELFLNEIKQISLNKPNSFEILIQTQGFAFMMHSRWNLVSNFQKYVEDTQKEYDKNKIIFIKELNKVYPNLIIEDEYGTHMFTGYELCCIKLLKQLKEINVDYLLIDTYLNKENKYDLALFEIYKKALSDLDNLDKYYEEIKLVSKNELSSGFIGGPNEIKHLLKYEAKNEK